MPGEGRDGIRVQGRERPECRQGQFRDGPGMGRWLAGVVVAIGLVAAGCSDSGGSASDFEGLRIGSTDAVVLARVDEPVQTSTKMATITATETRWLVGERFTLADGGSIVPVPAPPRDEPLEVRVSTPVDLVVGETYFFFIGYSGPLGPPWAWQAYLVLDGADQQPAAGTSQAVRDDVSRALFPGEDPKTDTLDALTQHVDELVAAIIARDIDGVQDVPLGPRSARIVREDGADR